MQKMKLGLLKKQRILFDPLTLVLAFYIIFV